MILPYAFEYMGRNSNDALKRKFLFATSEHTTMTPLVAFVLVNGSWNVLAGLTVVHSSFSGDSNSPKNPEWLIP